MVFDEQFESLVRRGRFPSELPFQLFIPLGVEVALLHGSFVLDAWGGSERDGDVVVTVRNMTAPGKGQGSK